MESSALAEQERSATSAGGYAVWAEDVLFPSEEGNRYILSTSVQQWTDLKKGPSHELAAVKLTKGIHDGRINALAFGHDP